MKQKQRLRLFKMTEIERNMLVKALYDIRGSDGREASEVECLIRKTAEAPDRRLYLTEPDYHWSMEALNVLRNAYLSAGRCSDGIDNVLLKIMKSKYRRAPAR